MMERETSTQKRSIAIDGKQDTEPEIVYFCHMIVVYVIIVTSIVNLSLQNAKREHLITLLCSTIDYLLPLTDILTSLSLKTSKT